MIPYTVYRTADGQFYALLSNGEIVGFYPTLAELERDMEMIEEHLAAGCFGGAR